MHLERISNRIVIATIMCIGCSVAGSSRAEAQCSSEWTSFNAVMSGLNDLAELHDELQSLQGTALTDLTMLEMNGCINSTADVAKKNSALTHLDRMTTALDAAFGDLADASSEMLLAMMDLMFGDCAGAATRIANAAASAIHAGAELTGAADDLELAYEDIFDLQLGCPMNP